MSKKKTKRKRSVSNKDTIFYTQEEMKKAIDYMTKEYIEHEKHQNSNIHKTNDK